MRAVSRALASLQIRLLLALFLVAIIPLGIVGGGGAIYARQVVAEESTRELTGLARGLAEELDLYFAGILVDAQAIAGLPDMASMDAGWQDEVLKDLFHLYPHFSYLATYDVVGRRVASSQPGVRSLPAELPGLSVSTPRAAQAWEVVIPPETDRLSFLALTPIRDSERRVVGVLVSAVDMQSLSVVVNRVHIGGGGEAFVVDSSGSVLLHPQQSAIRERRNYAWTGVTSGGRPAGAGTVRYSERGEARLAGFAPLPSIGWVVLVARPEAEMIAPAQRLWHLALGGIGVTILLGAIVSVVIARTLSRPVRDLAVAARAFGAGDPSAPLPPVAPGTNEIGTLVDAFATMREAVLSRERAHREAEEALRDEVRITETLHRVGLALSAELDLQKLVQAITDGGTDLSGARFGAFFYNVVGDEAEAYTLYTLSGARREDFASFPMPRNTSLFGPTFRGEPGAIRLDDVTEDPRYGKHAPHYGLPEGHLPVRSYLAVPVLSRSGDVLGGLFFGHPEPGVFTERAERLVVGLAAQAAIAIDNARLYQEAQQAIRTREEFLSVAAHELKTPITSLRLAAQILTRDLERDRTVEPERLGRMVEALGAQSEKLSQLVNQLLDIGRIEAGKLQLEHGEVDLTALVSSVVERMREESPSHTFTTTSTGPVSIIGDALRLEQVLVNLLNNAVKYSPGGGEIAVSLDLSSRDGRGGHEVARVSVRDHGIGIPAEDRERIFERFYQGQSAGHSVGLGLGLYISHEIVALHGGRLFAESPPDGPGAQLTFTLPVKPGQGGVSGGRDAFGRDADHG